MSTNTDNKFCGSCGQEIGRMSDAEMKHRILKAMAVVSGLIGQFDNPDNHAHQRDAIKEAKEFLKSA